jgi:hypothetical protein
VWHTYNYGMSKAVKRGRGRPSVGDRALGNPKTIRFGAALEAAIQEQIGARLDAPDFGGMVRELVAEAIEARKGKRK